MESPNTESRTSNAADHIDDRGRDRLNKVLDVPEDHNAGFTRKAVQFLGALLPVVAWGERCGVPVNRSEIASLGSLVKFMANNQGSKGRAMGAVMVPLGLYVNHIPGMHVSPINERDAEDMYRYYTGAIEI